MIAVQDGPVYAAGYIRVSQKDQADGYSPDNQRDSVRKLAREHGFVLAMLEEDHERGGKIARAGYQRILAAVRRGEIQAVLVYMFDRFGRNGAERVQRSDEFKRLGVQFISVKEGRDNADMLSFIRAGMDQTESVKIAQRVRANRQIAAVAGKHLGPTPFGYLRVYPEHIGRAKDQAGRLEPDPATAWIVETLYRRYADGNTALRDLADWLNTDPRVPKPKRARLWTANGSVYRILHNMTYKGAIEYNKEPSGWYERAGIGNGDKRFDNDGQHKAIIDAETWQIVQDRLDAAAARPAANRTRTKRGHATALLTSILHCPACDGLMGADNAPGALHYYCRTRAESKACTERVVKFAYADKAALDEVRKLRGKPWTPQAERRLINGDAPDKAAALEREIAAEQQRLSRLTTLQLALDDQTQEQIAEFSTQSRAISARIRDLKAQRDEKTQRLDRLPAMRAVHARVQQEDFASLIDGVLKTAAPVDILRPLLLELVASARIAARRMAGTHTRAVKLTLTWTDDIAELLECGLLTLDK